MSTLPTTRKKVPPVPDASSRSEGPGNLSLEQAFRSFTEAADSLESFYANLSSEVTHLRMRLDETNRELSESLEANRRMRLHLERILDALPCGVLVLDAHGEARLVNPEVHRMLETVDSEAGEGALAHMVSRLDSDKEIALDGEHELRLDGASGVTYVGARARTLVGNDRSGAETIWILRDLTDEKRLQEEMEAARRVQALADMAGLLAHEIRNPLGSLELFASLLAGEIGDGTEARGWADQLQAGLRTLAATVNNVLQFHSTSADVKTSVNIRDLVVDTVEFLSPMARQWRAVIRLSSGGGSSRVMADPLGLRQVFLNLAINAFGAMPTGGVLDIDISREVRGSREWVRIQFTDQGRGISPEDLDCVFDSGFSTKPNSSGLGLTVCRRIVEKNGGIITVSSVPDQGTTFALSFRAIGEME